jgi:cell division protein ZapA
MAEVSIAINGRNFSIYCEDGQEQRVTDLGHYVDARLKDISKAGAANNEAHLLVLTALMLTDEIFDLRDEAGKLEKHVKNAKNSQEDEAEVVQAINELADRVDQVSARIQSA